MLAQSVEKQNHCCVLMAILLVTLVVINACANGGKTDAALDVFKTMQQAGVVADTMSYNSLITACASGGKGEKAQ